MRARPLKRAIQKQLLDTIGLRLLQGNFRDGDVIKVDERGGAFDFERGQSAAAAA